MGPAFSMKPSIQNGCLRRQQLSFVQANPGTSRSPSFLPGYVTEILSVRTTPSRSGHILTVLNLHAIRHTPTALCRQGLHGSVPVDSRFPAIFGLDATSLKVTFPLTVHHIHRPSLSCRSVSLFSPLFSCHLPSHRRNITLNTLPLPPSYVEVAEQNPRITSPGSTHSCRRGRR